MSQGIEYSVDIVLCIDKTGSMSPVLDKVKAHALKFDQDLRSRMKAKDKEITSLRVRIVAFGDLLHDGESWINQSEFFELPKQSDSFESFVSKVSAEGGGDEPESGLEALALAFNSKWTSTGHRRRHVVVVWTDASAHPLEKRTGSSDSVFQELPSTFGELKDLWDSQKIGTNARRMVLFAPEAYPWSDIFNHFDETVLFPSRAGAGMAELEYDQILDMLSSSV